MYTDKDRGDMGEKESNQVVIVTITEATVFTASRGSQECACTHSHHIDRLDRVVLTHVGVFYNLGENVTSSLPLVIIY